MFWDLCFFFFLFFHTLLHSYLASQFVGVKFLVDYLSVSVTPSSMFESFVHLWFQFVCFNQKDISVPFLLVIILHRGSI